MQKIELHNRASTFEPSPLYSIEWVIHTDDTQTNTTASFEVKMVDKK